MEAVPYAYVAYGVTIGSTWELPELPPSSAADLASAISIRYSSDPCDQGEIDGFSGESVVVDHVPGGQRMRFRGLADFGLLEDLQLIEARACPGVPPSTVRHLLIDLVVPSVLGSAGELVLHASGVELPAGAVLFLGPSGAGKSTLAAGLTRRRRPVLCDDAARLIRSTSGFALAPSYPGLRLWPDGVARLVSGGEQLDPVAHNTDKVRWVPVATAPEPVPVACVFVLDDSPDGVEVGPVGSRQAVRDILQVAFRLPGLSPEALKRQFEAITDLVATTPVCRLAYPYDFSRLEHVLDVIEATVATAPDGARQ